MTVDQSPRKNVADLGGSWQIQQTRPAEVGNILGKFSRQKIDDIFFSIFQEIGFEILCKLSKETICIKCQILFSGKK